MDREEELSEIRLSGLQVPGGQWNMSDYSRSALNSHNLNFDRRKLIGDF